LDQRDLVALVERDVGEAQADERLELGAVLRRELDSLEVHLRLAQAPARQLELRAIVETLRGEVLDLRLADLLLVRAALRREERDRDHERRPSPHPLLPRPAAQALADRGRKTDGLAAAADRGVLGEAGGDRRAEHASVGRSGKPVRLPASVRERLSGG